MHVTFYGAAREVTGSMCLLTTKSDRILFDCGLFQGRRKESSEKNRVMPIDPAILSNVVLSHAHLDHSGRLPLLTKNGFNGRIIATRATVAACQYLLTDSAHIQESDAGYLNYKLVRSTLADLARSPRSENLSRRKLEEIKGILKKGKHRLDDETIGKYLQKYRLQAIEPLYSVHDAEQALSYFDGHPYREPIMIGKKTSCTFYDAGHILGSAMSAIKIEENGHPCTIMYSGDIGRFDVPIIKNPCLNFAEKDTNIDLLIMESTYGDRLHGPATDLKQQLQRVIEETFQRGGTLLIPAFAFGRTQTLLYFLHEIYNENKSLRYPVYVDSPLATRLTRVFAEHPEVYDKEAHAAFLEKGINPFQFDQLHFVSSVEESMAINRQEGPQIVIAASGMCEAGRILHHLRFKIHNAKNTVLLVGYMAQNTLGRRLEEEGLAYSNKDRQGPAPLLRLMNKEYPLKAHVVKIDGFSAHADRSEMLRFLKESNLRVRNIALVHGEEAQSLPFAKTLQQEGYNVFVPRRGETREIKSDNGS